MMQIRTLIHATACLCIAHTAASAAVVSYNLNTGPATADLGWTNSITSGISATNFATSAIRWSSTGGIDNGGTIVGQRPDMTNSATMTSLETLDNATGELEFGVYFYVDTSVFTGNTIGANDRSFNVGFRDVFATTNWENPAGSSAVFAQLGGARTGTSPNFTYTYDLRIGTRNAGANSVQGQNAATFTISQSGWYYWNTSFTATDPGWEITSTVYNASSSGAVGTQVATRSLDTGTGGPTLTSLSNPYAFLQYGEIDRMGLAAVDNLAITAVPEPTLLGALGLVSLIARRKRVAP